MLLNRRFLILLGLLFFQKVFCKNSDLPAYSGIENVYLIYDTLAFNEFQFTDRQRPNPIHQLFKKRRKENNRMTAAILAFPFPFGIVGLHRIYLGCAPYVPVVYIGTVGGGFGILPFIDFWVLILDKDMNRYMNNQKVFMWVN